MSRTYELIERDDLQPLVDYWKKILRVQDWATEVVFARNYRFEENGICGTCHWEETLKSAFIRIGFAEDRHPEAMLPLDQERTLVHELLHLHFAPFFQTDKKHHHHDAMEAVIHILSVTLVNLNRGIRPA